MVTVVASWSRLVSCDGSADVVSENRENTVSV